MRTAVSVTVTTLQCVALTSGDKTVGDYCFEKFALALSSRAD